MRAITTIFWGGALACVVMGCGDTDSNGAGDKNQFISQLCAEFTGCCEAAGRPSDGAQCRAFYGAFAPTSGYDATVAQACLDEVRAVDDKCGDPSSTSTPSCSKVFSGTSGTRQPGESCEDDSDCVPVDAGRIECVSRFVDGANVQQCQVRLPGKSGSAPCVGTVDGNFVFSSGGPEGIPDTGYLCDLADELSCDGQTGACQSLAAVGEMCAGGFYSCETSAYCAFPENVCTTRLLPGAACENDAACQEGTYCAPSSSTCVALRATGDTCAANAECESNDCTNQECAAESDLTLTFLCGSN